MPSDDQTQDPASFIDVPGDPTMTRTANIPPIRVPLPLEAKIRSGFHSFALHVAAAMLSGLTVWLGLWVLFGDGAGLDVRAAGLFTALLGAAYFINAVSFVIDLTRQQPLLTVDASGFWDRRATAGPIPWSQVESAKSITGLFSHQGAFLKLRRPVEARRRPIRLATFHYLFRRRGNELIVPVNSFSNRDIIVRAMLALVRRHGGAAKNR